MSLKPVLHNLKTREDDRFSVERVFHDEKSLAIFDSLVQDVIQQKLATEQDMELVRKRIHRGSAILFLVDDGATVVILSFAGAKTACVELVYRRYMTQTPTLPYVVVSLRVVAKVTEISRYVFRTRRRGLARYLHRLQPCRPYGQHGNFFEVLMI